MTRSRVQLGAYETELLERLWHAHPGGLSLDGCDGVALGNLVAIACAQTGSGGVAWITEDGLALWATRTVVWEPGDQCELLVGADWVLATVLRGEEWQPPVVLRARRGDMRVLIERDGREALVPANKLRPPVAAPSS